MFIQTEQTPNPETLKFLPGRDVMPSGAGLAEFKSADEAASNQMAESLFALGQVERVFYGADFISVTKSQEAEWDTLKTRIMALIMDHITAGFPFYEVSENINSDGGNNASQDDELTLQIKELLDTRVRPMVAQDGGDIIFHKFEEGIVYLQMRGACAGCPSSTMTLKSGIENMLRHYVPEVLEVRPAEEY